MSLRLAGGRIVTFRVLTAGTGCVTYHHHHFTHYSTSKHHENLNNDRKKGIEEEGRKEKDLKTLEGNLGILA